jgi:solute carrier family 35 protein F5
MARIRTRAEWTLGIIFILLVALIWNFATILVQYIFEHMHFKEPFFVTYIANTLFVVYLPVWFTAERFRLFGVQPLPRRYSDEKSWCSFRFFNRREPSLLASAAVTPHSTFATTHPLPPERTESEDGIETKITPSDATSLQTNQPVLSHRQLARIGMCICPLWFIANVSYTYSLSLTTNTSSTIIATTSSLFTYIFGVVFSDESFTPEKLVSISFLWRVFKLVQITLPPFATLPFFSFQGGVKCEQINPLISRPINHFYF